MANNPTAFRDEVTLPIRGAEILSIVQFLNGANFPGSNSPGIGIATAGDLATQNLAESDPQWTLLDQDEDPRTPQVGQHIGGNGLGAGVEGKGTMGIATGVNVAAASGAFIAPLQNPHLIDLATGWEGVVPGP